MNKDIATTSRDATSCTKPPITPNQVYSQPIVRPPPRPPDTLEPNPTQVTTQIETNLDFEENSPHEEGIITKMYESPDKSYLEQPQELSDLVDSTKIIHKYLPKQVENRQDLEHYQEKGLERHTFTINY